MFLPISYYRYKLDLNARMTKMAKRKKIKDYIQDMQEAINGQIKQADKEPDGWRKVRIPFSYRRIGKTVEPATVDSDAYKKYMVHRKKLERIRKQHIKCGRINPKS